MHWGLNKKVVQRFGLARVFTVVALFFIAIVFTYSTTASKLVYAQTPDFDATFGTTPSNSNSGPNFDLANPSGNSAILTGSNGAAINRAAESACSGETSESSRQTCVINTRIQILKNSAAAACANESKTDGIINSSYTACVIDTTNQLAESARQDTVANQEQGGVGGVGDFLAEHLSNIIYVFTVGLGSLVAYISAYLLNLAIYISLNSTAYAMQFITEAWTSVRDIANIGFIFILIYIGVKVMLQAEDSGTLKTLGRVIVFALLINFSFFFARVVIDGGNILAINFYNQIQAPALSQSAAAQGGSTAFANNVVSTVTFASQDAKDLTANIMGAINVQDILNTQSFKEFSTSNNFLTKLITLAFIYICVGIIFGLLAAMFFTIAIKFISRVVVLWLVIIAAPIALLLAALPKGVPQVQGYVKQWIHALIVYSIYPAIFLFLFIIIAKFAYGLACPGIQGTVCNSSVLNAAFNDINNSHATGVAYIVGLISSIGIRLGFIMVLLYFTTKASDWVSAMGGKLAQQITAKPDKFAAGLAGMSRRFTQWQGKAALAPAGYVARLPGAGAALVDSRLKSSGLGAGGRWNPLSNAVRGVQKGVLQPLQGASILGAQSYKDNKEAWKKELTERTTNRTAVKDSKSLEELMKELSSGTSAAALASNPALKEAINMVQNMSEARMKELSSSQIKTLSKVFTENQMKVVEKLEKISEQDKETAKKNFNEHSPHSPIYKAQKQLEELRKISKQLSTSSYKMTKTETHLDSGRAAKGESLSSAELVDIRTEIKKQTAQIRSDIKKARPGDDTFDMQQSLDTLQEAAKKLDKFDENMGKAPAGSQAKIPA